VTNAPPEVVDELYGAPLDEFVASRDARAKQLRAEGRRDEADAVKRLSKPRVPAWAVNQIRRRDPDALDGLMAAGAALRQARAGALRTAAREEREAVGDLVEEAVGALRDAGHEPSSAAIDEIRETLHAAAADAEARELVAAGRVVEPLRAIGLGGLPGGGGPVAEPDTKQRSARTGRRRADGSRSDRPAGRRTDADRSERASRRADRERAKRRLAEAREEVRAARSEVRERERELHAAERDLRAAEDAADKARGALAAARERLERREAKLEAARGGRPAPDR
jgi:hypothetical protein